MSAAKLTWISIALLLPTLTAWGAEVCHSPRTRSFGSTPSGPPVRISSTTTVVQQDVITQDVEKVDEEKAGGRGFNAYVHPFGEIREKTTTTLFLPPPNPPRTIVSTRVYPPGLMFEDCCTCGDNENAAYQLKIFSKHQDPTTGQKFDKPILVTQGFDASYRTAEQFRFGKFELQLNDVFDETTGERTTDTGLLRLLYDNGYDIALLLWKNPLIDIKTNAQVTLQALRWLESYTDPREGTEPVVIGPSMGGLVTRYALQLAGRDFPASDISARLFIAFDSPNRGAEIPMSLQALIRYFNDQSEGLTQRYANLTSVAARQLLLSSVDERAVGVSPPGGRSRFQTLQRIRDYENPTDPENLTASTHATFIADINRTVFREQMKRIVHRFKGEEKSIYTAALINGSGTGGGLGYTEDLLYATGSSAQFGLALEVELRTARAGGLATVFDGDINPQNIPNKPNKYSLTYFFQEPAFVENAPGGLRSTYRELIDAVRTQGFPWNEVDPRFENQGSQGNHAFIPSLSGVGLLDRDINNNASWSTEIGREGKCVAGPTCMFDEFRAPVTNQEHVTVTRENKEWFLELICEHGPQTGVEPIAGVVCEIEGGPGGVLRASFGYNNTNVTAKTIALGKCNRFTGQGIEEKEVVPPEQFQPGTHSGVVHVIFGGFTRRGVPAWTLEGTTVKASIPARLRPCPPSFPGG